MDWAACVSGVLWSRCQPPPPLSPLTLSFPFLAPPSRQTMSQSDVRSILNLPSSSQSSHIRPPTGAGPALQRQRPEGVSREVYNLIGDNVPSLQAAVFEAAPALKFKEKPKTIVKRPKAEKW